MGKQTPEGKVKAAIQKELARYGVVPFMKAADSDAPVNGVYWMPGQGPYSVQGVHDFVICWLGNFVSIETKAPDNPEDATQPQEAFQTAITKAGGYSFTGVRSADIIAVIADKIGAPTP